MVKITMDGRNGDDYTLQVKGSEVEINALKKALQGHGYFSDGQDGRALFSDIFIKVEPTADPVCAHHFTPLPSDSALLHPELPAMDPEKWNIQEGQASYYSIFVEHLCGYNYTPERATAEMEKLTAWGFECLRSPRGKEGRYWELWYLPGLWAAKGTMAGIKTIEEATRFLCRHCSFGSMQVTRQAAAMTVD